MDKTFPDFPEEMTIVRQIMLESINSGCDLLREVAGFMELGRGKLLRPRLLVLIGRSMGRNDDRLLQMAASVELIHTATLLHDDVIDKSNMRRGKASVNARYGDDVAILMADLLFSKAFDLGLSAVDPEAMRLICRVTREMCEGEMFQIEKRDAILTEEDYFQIIHAKTASLFSATAMLGGILANTAPENRVRLGQFGFNVGIAFQIVDDVLDYTVSEAQMGKSTGNDLERGKQTLPLIRTFELASERDRQELLHQLRNGRQMEKVLPVIQKYGGLEYSTHRAWGFIEEADGLVGSLGLDTNADLFRALCRFVVERTN